MKFTFAPESRPLEGYTIKRAIYRGGFGEVYYALTDAGREVALKLLQNNSEVELRGVQQCLNLSHPNLVTIFDVKRDRDGDHWIVMEYVAGETLDAAIHRHPGGMPMEEVRNWLRGMAEGVAFLHDQGIVHRDLKPGNVFSDGGTVKVGDVGLSKFITPSRRSAQTQSVGTVYYMAPEVAKGRYGREVDVYAMGIILYEMLTGGVPFDGESTGEILMKHLSERPDLERLPPRLRPVIDTALQKDPAQRFASVRELQQAFEAAVIGRSPSVGKPVRNPVHDRASFQPMNGAAAHSQAVHASDPTWSVWRPSRLAFWLILLCGLIGTMTFGVHGRGGVAAYLLLTGTCYLAYVWGRDAVSRGAAPHAVADAIGWLDGRSPALGSIGGRWWIAAAAAWLLFVVGGVARSSPGHVISVAVPMFTLLLIMFWIGRAVVAIWRGVTGLSVYGEKARTTLQQEIVNSHREHHVPNPVHPPPVGHGPRRPVHAPRARHYYRHRKTSPSMYRPISFRTRMSQYTTAASLVVPIIALLTGSVAMISPEFFASGLGSGLGWENVGLFGCTAVVASWVLLGLSKWNEGRRLDGGTRRLLQMAGGVAVGAAAFWISEVLLISPTPPTETFAATLWSQPPGAAFVSLADRPLFLEGGRPSLLGYVAFFGVLFGLRRWWWHADSFRPKRFRIGSVVLTVLMAWLIASFWSFPMVWAMTWAAVISSAVQLASPWTPPEERFATREV